MRSIIRKIASVGLLAGTLLAGALFVSPAHAAEPVVDLSFQEDILCTPNEMSYGINVTNNGGPVTVQITRFTTASVGSEWVNLGSGNTTKASINTLHYKIIRLVIKVGDVTLLDSGQRTSTGMGGNECNLPLPATRNDISFDVTATCSGITGNYTITATTTGPSAAVDLTWIGKNGVPTYPEMGVPASGQTSHTEIIELGVVNSVLAYDAWGRQLYNSGDLIADGDGCPRSAQRVLTREIDVECVAGSPVLYVHLQNDGDYREFFEFEYQVGHEDEEIGESDFDSLEVGESYEVEAPFEAGKALLVTLSPNNDSPPFFEFSLTAEETTCADPVDGEQPTDEQPTGEQPTGEQPTGEQPTDETAGDGGSQPPAADPQEPTAPVTPETPRSLPSTGRTSTSLVLVAAAFLLSGLGMRLAGRRQG